MVSGARERPLLHLLAAVALVLVSCLGCGSTYAVRHTVQAGDTVGALARRYGVSEAELRRFNELERGDQLRLGDVIFVPGAQTDRGRAAPAPPPATPPGVSAAAPVQPPPPASVSPPPRPASTPVRAAVELAWPATGEVLRGFGSGPAGDNRGIDIAAAADTAVHAAGGGTVTYAGAPAPAYGTIVIVEHPGKLFTVYSQLASATVGKGVRVTRGQEVGRVAAGKPSHLHFEVRRDERAVDPLLFLPPR